MKSLKQYYVDVCNDYLKSGEQDNSTLIFGNNISDFYKQKCITILCTKGFIENTGTDYVLTEKGKIFHNNKEDVHLTINDIEEDLQ